MKSFKEYNFYLSKNHGNYTILPPKNQRENGSGYFIKEFRLNSL